IASAERWIALLRWSLRIRTLHATVLRRSRATGSKKILTFTPPNLVEDTAVLCVARGGSYPALSAPISERAGLIGALSLETAARYLDARDVDGVIVGEGLGPGAVEALLTMLADNARLHDLPVGVLNNPPPPDNPPTNLLHLEAHPLH